MTGEMKYAAEWSPGMTGLDVILATVGEFCPDCGAILSFDGPHPIVPGLVGTFAMCPAPRCRWLCDQSLGVIPSGDQL